MNLHKFEKKLLLEELWIQYLKRSKNFSYFLFIFYFLFKFGSLARGTSLEIS